MPRAVSVKRRFSLSSILATGPGALVAGPNDPTLGVNDATVGTVAWTNPDRVYHQDGQVADTGGPPGTVTQYLKTTGYGFAFAGTEHIQGVKVECYGWSDGVIGTDFGDFSVKLVKAGVISGISLAAGFFPINTSMPVTYKPWGGGLQMWGLPWAPADINDAGFGCVLSFKNFDPIQTRVVLIDHIRMSVYYT